MAHVLPNFYSEKRPWGRFDRFTENEPSTVKLITLEPGQQFSLQKHAERSEFWRVVAGEGTVTVGERASEARVGSEFFVKAGELHRAKASAAGLTFLEISFGPFSEKDIIRVEDDYGRV